MIWGRQCPPEPKPSHFPICRLGPPGSDLPKKTQKSGTVWGLSPARTTAPSLSHAQPNPQCFGNTGTAIGQGLINTPGLWEKKACSKPPLPSLQAASSTDPKSTALLSTSPGFKLSFKSLLVVWFRGNYLTSLNLIFLHPKMKMRCIYLMGLWRTFFLSRVEPSLTHHVSSGLHPQTIRTVSGFSCYVLWSLVTEPKPESSPGTPSLLGLGVPLCLAVAPELTGSAWIHAWLLHHLGFLKDRDTSLLLSPGTQHRVCPNNTTAWHLFWCFL